MILFIDGMGHYSTDEIHAKYTTVDTTNTTWEIVAEGRFNNALKRTGTFTVSNGYIEIAPLVSQEGVWTPTDSGVMGFAVKVYDLNVLAEGGTGTTQIFFGVYESGFRVFHVSLNSNGTLTAYRSANGAFGVNGTFLAQSVQGLRENIWHYVEFKWKLGSADDAFLQIRVNEVPVLNYGILADGTLTNDANIYGTNNNYSFTNVWTSVLLGHVGDNGFSSPSYIWYGDLYLADLEGSGDQVRDYIGDCTIDVIVPDGVGNDADWTPLSGANWDNTEEIPPDEDTTYVSTDTVGDRDSYSFEDVPAGTVPVVYQQLVYAKKETEGAALIKPTIRPVATTYDMTAQGVATAAEYRYIIQPYDTNPETGLTITESEINAAEFGHVKVG